MPDPGGAPVPEREFDLEPPDNERLASLCGPLDENLRLIESRLGVQLRRRGSSNMWWLELAGLRDPAALPGKLALLHQLPNYLLAVPRAACPAPLPDHPRLLRFARHVAVADVLTRCGP